MPDIHVHIHGADLAEKPSSGKSKRATTRSPSKKKSTPRKSSRWQKYMKNKRTQIKYKGGKNKGKLNLKAMGAKYRKTKR
jgi:hypothetical protein